MKTWLVSDLCNRVSNPMTETPPSTKAKTRQDDADNPPVIRTDDFSHPVFKRLSQINGAINKLKKDELKEKLDLLGLNSNGSKEVIKKRLKNYWKNRKLIQSRLPTDRENKYNYILVIDFEATCDSTNPDNYRHEIIEFPVVVVDCETKTIVDQFHSYVRPSMCPTLTPFCITLTGIQQSQVSAAEPFPVVLDRMWEWVRANKYDRRMAVLTDGPWDMSRFMYLQCQFSGLRFPKWARKWINIRKTFSNFYDCKRLSLSKMLEAAGFSFVGKPHSGLDDSKNIARLVVRLLEDGCKLIVNEQLFSAKLQSNLKAFKGKGEVVNLNRSEAEALPSSDSDDDGSDSEGESKHEERTAEV